MDFTYLKQFMNSLVDLGIPGNAAVVYKDRKKVFEYSAGFSSIEKQEKMNVEKLLYIYSCSKPITVTAALQLYEQGKFLLSDPLYEYIPAFRKMYVKSRDGKITECKKHITINNLFTMTSGLNYDFNLPAYEKAKQLTNGKMDTLEVIKCLAKEPLSFEPGEHWMYGMSHDVLAGVVEVISGMKFRDYVQKNIFDKLEMNDSTYMKSSETEAKMAEQYIYISENSGNDIVSLQKSKQGFDGRVKNVGKNNSFVFGENYDSGGAGIITTVNDYAKFAAALAAGGIGLNGEKILSEATVELMSTNRLNKALLKDFNWPQLSGYGYGLGVRTMIDKAKGGSNGSIGEFGWGGAAGATVLIDKKENLAVFYAHHMLNPHEEYYQPRLRNVIYSCIK